MMRFNIGMRKFVSLFILLGLFLIIILPFGSALSATVSVPSKYQEVSAGETVFFQTEVKFPENEGRTELTLEYFILDSEENEIAYLKVLRAVETQASFIESLVLPEDLPSGSYRVRVVLTNYEDLSGELGASFNVVGKDKSLFETYLVIIGIVVIILVILLSAELFIHLREESEHVKLLKSSAKSFY